MTSTNAKRGLKINKLLTTVGAIILVLAIFLMMCVSDVVRLNEGMKPESATQLIKVDKEALAEKELDIVVPFAEVAEGAETNFSKIEDKQPLADGLPVVVVGSDDHVVISYEQASLSGAKLDTDKFKKPKSVEVEGVQYIPGTLKVYTNLWDGLNGWSKFVATVAPVLNVCAIIGAIMLLVGVYLSGKATATNKNLSYGSYIYEKINPNKTGKFIMNNIIILLILLFAIVVAWLKPSFASEDSIRNLLSNTAIRFIIALGVSGCLITKGTDLSAGRVAGLAACLSAILLQRFDYGARFYPGLAEMPIIVVLLIVLAICAVIGLINGAVVAIFKVPPFIATLGMQTLVYGICLVYTGASPIGGLREDYTSLALGYVGNRMFSYIMISAVIIGVLMWFLYNKTRHGKYMYAIGGNEVAAEVAGINTTKSKLLIYMLAAILYGVMGFLSTAKSGGASVNTAMGYELEAIAGCTIGGVSVNGGVGKVSGILIGVLVFEVLKVALQFLGVESSYTYIVQGLVIIIAVALDLRKYLAKK